MPRSLSTGLAWLIAVSIAMPGWSGEPTVPSPTPTPTPPSAKTVALELIEAFNRHEPEAMAALVSDDFELYYVNDAGASERALRGPEQLAEEMTQYFAVHPSVRSEVVETVDGPAYVSFREQIVGGKSSIAVYEVRDGRVKRVWYYPAE